MTRPFLLLGVLFLATSSHADPQAQMIRALASKYKPSLVTLSLIVKMSASGYENQSEMEAGGVLLDSSGLVATTNHAIDPMAAYAEEAESSGSSMTSRVSSIKILLWNGQEIPAKVVLRDKDKNIAFVRPLRKPLMKLSPVDFHIGASAQIGDPVYLLGRQGKTGSRSMEAKTQRIVSVMDKPRRFYVLDAIGGLYIGNVAFNEQGQPLGLLTWRFPVGKARQRERSLPVILPTRDVWAAARQAPQAKDVKEATLPRANSLKGSTKAPQS